MNLHKFEYALYHPDKCKHWALEEYNALPRVPHKKATEFQHYFVYLFVFEA